MSQPTAYIPNHNGGERLLDVIESLATQTCPLRVVIVDNASTDGSPARVQEHFPEVRLIELNSNFGFGRAINEAVRRIPGDPVILINNDCICEPRMIAAMLDQAAPRRSVAGVLLSADGSGRIDSAGIDVDASLLQFEHLHGEPVEALESARSPLGPTAGAALYPLEVFTDLGGFDEMFFAYLEDVELALRLVNAGYQCRLAPDARAIHAHSSTLGSGSRAKNHLMGFGRGYIIGRYRIMSRAPRAARALICESALCFGQLVIDHTHSGISGRFEGYRAGRRLPARAIPESAVTRIGMLAALRRRSRRRRRRGAG